MINAPRGTNDFYGDPMEVLLELEQTIIELCRDYGYGQVRTPMFEQIELFKRGVGENTDIVAKEMYTFLDKSKQLKEYALKPEGTAGVVRAYLERRMDANSGPTKLYYITPAFRYEKPEAGRYRQFHQFGVELFGVKGPMADVEVISLGYELLKRLGIINVKLYINSLGSQAARIQYNQELTNYLHIHQSNLCPTCQERIDKNPLRVLDCKEDSCQPVIAKAPLLLDYLTDEDRQHFEQVQTMLTELAIEYTVDPKIVRGLDYYSRTVFEFISEQDDFKKTVCGGGRYDRLIEELGGRPTPAIGFGAGMERLLLMIEQSRGGFNNPTEVDLFVGYIGPTAKIEALKTVTEYRRQGIRAATDLLEKSLKNQMKFADKIKARYSFIIGEEELKTGKVAIKQMATGQEETIDLTGVAEYMKNKPKQ